MGVTQYVDFYHNRRHTATRLSQPRPQPPPSCQLYAQSLLSSSAFTSLITNSESIMSPSGYQAIEHNRSCQHMREYPKGAKLGRRASLKLTVEQYKPLQPSKLPPDAVTIIVAHVSGFPKVRQPFLLFSLKAILHLVVSIFTGLSRGCLGGIRASLSRASCKVKEA